MLKDEFGDRERLSEFMDGEAEALTQADVVRSCRSRDDLREDWVVFHCIGDVLRSPDLACDSGKLRSRIVEAVRAEPPWIAASAPQRGARSPGRFASIAAGFAAVAAVALVALPLWRAQGDLVAQRAPAATATAAGPASAVAPAADPPAVSAPVSREYVAAHRQYSGGLAMQGLVGRVRNVAYESGN